MTKDEIIKRLAEINDGLSVLDKCESEHVRLVIFTEDHTYRFGEFMGNTVVVKTTLLVEKECLEEELKEIL